MPTGDSAARPLVVFLTEDTYAQPLVKLATELIAAPLGAEARAERVDQSLLLHEGKLRKKLWAIYEKARGKGFTLLRIDGFVDSEDEPKILAKAPEVEQAIKEPLGGARPLPVPFRLHVLKPNQEGLLLNAHKVLVEASERTINELGVAGQEAALANKAQHQIASAGKRPKKKQAILERFNRLFAGRPKSYYMTCISNAPGFSAACFEDRPNCMEPEALGISE